MKKDKVITLKTLTKSSVWEVQENDVFRLWEAAEKDNDLKDNQRKYLDIIRSAFEMEKVTVDRPEVLDKLTERGFKIGTFRIDDQNVKYAIKKRPIMRVTDLTSNCWSATSVADGKVYLRASKTSSRATSTSAPLPFLRIV